MDANFINLIRQRIAFHKAEIMRLEKALHAYNATSHLYKILDFRPTKARGVPKMFPFTKDTTP